ncbi:acyl-CoA thioesterase/BAAT N-terminal domain-containing protein [Leifsonia sp. F6_8S_P_1B]|uniref:Acyl-CoA thioesterase/BAAT N-terminal domain-containing protein n=1 Tax=Leifsonia williamsii TaxID=3035919 RepID=A0ABT8KA08_9MICO|nr:acyl-CoA thioesterase/BAAT N-terminal domain-containing protein [Leifsonia williamsii]MDN4614289.1 acyl-CoA thioesterase/BAAT N-terminal domain-containing protein [Leifsonia williamsii]
MSRRPARLAALVATAVCAVMLAGCGVPTAGGPHLVVREFGTTVTSEVGITLQGLRPGEPVVLTATARTSAGTWRSRSVFPVPPDGTVSLAAQQPALGAYAGADPGGPLWSMSGPPTSQDELERAWAYGGVDVVVAADQGGRRVATTTLRRQGLAEVTAQRFVEPSELVPEGVPPDATGTPSAATAGWVVVPFPLPSGSPRPGVLLIDGDEGGASAVFAARVIAAAGFPVFVLPAFGPPGQLPGSAALSVEAFDAALSWFAGRRLVDQDRVLVYGTGAASGMALWFASHRPDRVRGAIAAGGPTALLCAARGGSPTLTDHGEPVPCEDGTRAVADTALPPVRLISGPVVLACGLADETLPSTCEWADAVHTARGRRVGDVVMRTHGAAHDVVTAPLLPIGLDDLPPATAQATEQGRRTFWAAVIGTLEQEARR